MSMYIDGHFWDSYFKEVFIPQINTFYEAIVNRILPTFATIAQEAEDVAQTEYERLGNLPAFGNQIRDMADIAEEAEEVALEHYEALKGVRQSLINLAATALYHMFEQQLLLFHRKQFLDLSNADNISLIKLSELKKKLKDIGLNIEKFKPWTKIKELKLVANSVKHAEGRSAENLKKLRSDLFARPHFKDERSSFTYSPRVYMPLAGEDIYVTIEDLSEYQSALVLFWEKFGEAVKQQGVESYKAAPSEIS